MSFASREPMWYCHECHAEMRPLMQPDPHCASCHGTFVEKIESGADDPREFQQVPGGLDPNEFAGPGTDNFLLGLQSLMGRPPNMSGNGPRSRTGSPAGGERSIRIEMTSNSGRGTRTYVFGSPNTLGARPGGASPNGARGDNDTPPRLSEFIRRGPEGRNPHDGMDITGPMMAQYLLALLSQRRNHGETDLNALFGLGMGGMAGMPEGGRWGDYVFNQEALDQIITQLMENSNANRPVPATEEIISALPRTQLERGSPLLEKDCAVCKEQFKLETEDPEEQTVITLPCKHPFHQGCILPWLKSSGTCPVCRHALVPQPEHYPPGPGPPGPTGGSRPHSPSGRPRSPAGGRRSGPGSPEGGGLFNMLFGRGGVNDRHGGSGHDRSSSGHDSRSHARRSSDTTSRRRESSSDRRDIPGSWDHDVD